MAGFSNPLPPPHRTLLGGAAPLAALKKRKAFFSFHFDDIMRVNNVRNAWKIDHPDNALMRSFYDSSLWESRKLEGDEAVKRLIREGVEHTSAVCVLIGADTWSRRWVKYEIARAVIDNRGLLGVHINSINHHVRRCPCPVGHNPLAQLAVGKVQPNALMPAAYYLFEYTTHGWQRYNDYMLAVSRPAYLPDPAPGYVMQLSVACAVHNFQHDNGHQNIGVWIDAAARAVGR